MKLSMKWLADYTDVSEYSTKEYCDRMTDSGSKVESYTLLGDDVRNVVVARIKSLEKHPDSDHLQICQMLFHHGRIYAQKFGSRRQKLPFR